MELEEPTGADRLPQSVLIVEDSWFLAMEVEAWLQEDGVGIAGIAGNSARALELAEVAAPDFAVVDFNLGGEFADGLIRRLRELGAKVIVVTGYSNLRSVEGAAAVVQKPCTKAQMLDALHYAGLAH